MIAQINEIATKNIKDVIKALQGTWGSELSIGLRYQVLGKIAVVESRENPASYNFPFKAYDWATIGNTDRGTTFYIAFIQ